MDAHVFRSLCRILALALHRGRLERIHEPVPGVTAFSLYAEGKKQCLLLRRHRAVPLLFLTDKFPLPNPAFPPAAIMRLRKYAEGRILGEVRCNWPDRQIAFALPGPEAAPDCWLLLDCRNGPAILQTLPDEFGAKPLWPDPAALPALLGQDQSQISAPWEQFRVLSPMLRQTLAHLDPIDAAALLVDLEEGGGDLFWYAALDVPISEDNPPLRVSAWPLPPAERGTRFETVTPTTPEAVLPLLRLLQLPLVLTDAKSQAEAPVIKKDKSVSQRRNRLLAKLEAEKTRLESMLALGDDARLLQTHLWSLPQDEHLQEIRLPLDPAQPEGQFRGIPLNPMLSVGENMQIMFRKAAKAARGLDMLERRFALEREAAPSPPPRPASSAPDVLPGKKNKKPLFSPSLIQEFVSSDGFTLWRGRNAEGNRALLKLARPFDLWFHVEDGPSAHLLVRRDHAAHNVPDRTQEEAAILVGLKSWRRDDPRASVMVALAKHVQPVKGAGPGTVRVQEILRTLFVDIDPECETALRS